jgi:protein Tex
MELEGTVTNVAAFGAFVDVGVHQDGLVHISELADRFVKDPHEVVKAGDVVKVRVKEVDVQRKRIGLTMRSGAIDRNASAGPGAGAGRGAPGGGGKGGSSGSRTSAPPPKGGALVESAFAAALRRAQERR